jgi:hypothetical protein
MVKKNESLKAANDLLRQGTKTSEVKVKEEKKE